MSAAADISDLVIEKSQRGARRQELLDSILKTDVSAHEREAVGVTESRRPFAAHEPRNLLGTLFVQRVSPHATLPVRATLGAAGYDLSAAEFYLLPAQSRCVVDTGISIQMPNGVYGRIGGRSGLAAKFGITVGGGVIDPDYRGTIKVILFNHSKVDFTIKVGDRVAQLILENYIAPPVVEADLSDDASSLLGRGAGGFGSTGMGALPSSTTTSTTTTATGTSEQPITQQA